MGAAFSILECRYERIGCAIWWPNHPLHRLTLNEPPTKNYTPSRNPDAAIDRVCSRLNEQEIFPFHEIKQPANTTELLDRIKAAVGLLDTKDKSTDTLADSLIEENEASEEGRD